MHLEVEFTEFMNIADVHVFFGYLTLAEKFQEAQIMRNEKEARN